MTRARTDKKNHLFSDRKVQLIRVRSKKENLGSARKDVVELASSLVYQGAQVHA
jgi:hypothetical protein